MVPTLPPKTGSNQSTLHYFPIDDAGRTRIRGQNDRTSVRAFRKNKPHRARLQQLRSCSVVLSTNRVRANAKSADDQPTKQQTRMLRASPLLPIAWYTVFLQAYLFHLPYRKSSRLCSTWRTLRHVHDVKKFGAPRRR